MSARVWLEDPDFKIVQGDVRDALRTLPAGSIDCVVTSPPYWSLRSYGIPPSVWGGDEGCEHEWDDEIPSYTSSGSGTPDGKHARGEGYSRPDARGQLCVRCRAWRGQLGLEPTPEMFLRNMVEVFGDVRRVLADHGTCWVNIGSNYAGADGYPLTEPEAAWLAGLIDGEGCIQIHEQQLERCQHSFQLDLSVGMMDREAVERAHQITGLGSCKQQNRGVWDWSVRGRQTADLLRAIYPWLTVKRQQAALGIMLAEHIVEQRGNRVRPLTAESIAYRQALKRACSACNQRQEPAITPVPPRPIALGIKAKDDLLMPARLALALQRDGWFVRSEVIWHKLNPIPESVTDRPTKAHEQVFLLSKSASYFYDHLAVQEPAEWARWGDQTTPKYEGTGTASGWMQARTKAELHAGAAARSTKNENVPTDAARERKYAGFNDRWDDAQADGSAPLTRNKRSVWPIASQPFPEAHFATFPEALVETPVKAGTSERGKCPGCGLPWRRVVERGELQGTDRGGNYKGREGDADAAGANRMAGTIGGYKPGLSYENRTVGWEPSCSCGGEPVPCVTLDPFMGSGTVALVSRKLGRFSVGCEINEEYCRIASRRVERTGPFWQLELV